MLFGIFKKKKIGKRFEHFDITERHVLGESVRELRRAYQAKPHKSKNR